MTREIDSNEGSLPELPAMLSPDQDYANGLSSEELSLLMTGASEDWGVGDSEAGSTELDSALAALSVEANGELQRRAFGLTQVRAQTALEELQSTLDGALVKEYELAGEDSTDLGYEDIESVLSDGIESVKARHFTCW